MKLPILALCTAMTLSADALPFTMVFDENGIGSINVNGTGTVGFNGSLTTDSSSTIGKPVLTWMFSDVGLSGLPSGDMVIHNVDFIIDVIRITNSLGSLTGTTGDRLIFYSNGRGFLADTDFPPNQFSGNVLASVFEVDPFTTITLNGIYTFVAKPENLPEPSTYLSMAAGLILLSAIGRRRPARLNS